MKDYTEDELQDWLEKIDDVTKKVQYILFKIGDV